MQPAINDPQRFYGIRSPQAQPRHNIAEPIGAQREGRQISPARPARTERLCANELPWSPSATRFRRFSELRGIQADEDEDKGPNSRYQSSNRGDEIHLFRSSYMDYWNLVTSIMQGGSSLAAILLGSDALVENCTISGLSITTSGFYTYGIVIGLRGIVRNCAVCDCSVGNRTFRGIGTADYCLVENCNVSGNSSPGAPAIYGAFSTASRSAIKHCVAGENSTDGIVSGDGSTISDCTVRRNTGDGIRVSATCFVLNNTVSGNGTGIHATGERNRIDGNHITGNSGDGLLVDDIPSARKNVVVRNSSYGNGNYQFRIPRLPLQGNPGDNDVGPIAPASSNSSPWGNISP
jgi:parallel beta-helix repeat protein